MIFMNRLFHFKENQTTLKQELLAGLTSYFTIAYILIINPAILADAGIPYAYALAATILATAAGCFMIGGWGNAPMILTPGMGINAFFTYTIVQGFGLTWQQGLAAVIAAGLLFFIATITPLAGIMVRAVPDSLKIGITVGVGIFLTFIGLQKGQLITADTETFVTMGAISSPQALLTILGLLITMGLFVRKVKGSFLIGIVLTTGVAFLFGLTNPPQADSIQFTGYTQMLGASDFSGVYQLSFWTAVFSLMIILMFESMGLLNGMLPDKKKFPKSYQASAASAFTSGLFGTSPTIPTVESASGIAEGGRTGLTAITVGVLFLASAFFAPMFTVIPDGAVAPVLIIVGGLMVQEIRHIRFQEMSEWLPAYLIIGLIPLTYSIADGIAFGFIAYPLLKLALGEPRSVSPIMYVISSLFFLHYVLMMVI
ncbi:AGZA family xanthine/uracil permease-like MFS transporter [Sinobaca qinghaiensis]|uniref:AGZA family xanthine/uracil permease-like MFS transporter n=1 Tax=Sinobaca qinghaiensis TaxID=342944 RepID=A0A419V424_9BACL|nr:AGZA family xanthine/uracil permease-like MFS transporter [Sinobaca qinghaiensis]